MSLRIIAQRTFISGRCSCNVNLFQFYLHTCFKCSRVWQSKGHIHNRIRHCVQFGFYGLIEEAPWKLSFGYLNKTPIKIGWRFIFQDPLCTFPLFLSWQKGHIFVCLPSSFESDFISLSVSFNHHVKLKTRIEWPLVSVP